MVIRDHIVHVSSFMYYFFGQIFPCLEVLLLALGLFSNSNEGSRSSGLFLRHRTVLIDPCFGAYMWVASFVTAHVSEISSPVVVGDFSVSVDFEETYLDDSKHSVLCSARSVGFELASKDIRMVKWSEGGIKTETSSPYSFGRSEAFNISYNTFLFIYILRQVRRYQISTK